MPRPNAHDKILQAGLETLHLRGFNATSVQDITDAAGAPKGSFYNHFASKDDLGAAVVDLYAAKVGTRLTILQDVALPPLARLRRYFEAMVELAGAPDAKGCLLGNFGAELSHQSPLISQRVSSSFAGWTEAIEKVVAEAQIGDPKLVAAFVINSWEGAVLRFKIDRNPAPFEAFLNVMFSKVLV